VFRHRKERRLQVVLHSLTLAFLRNLWAISGRLRLRKAEPKRALSDQLVQDSHSDALLRPTIPSCPTACRWRAARTVNEAISWFAAVRLVV
jgi:hypothetical protein